jgi:hypothetical protein
MTTSGWLGLVGLAGGMGAAFAVMNSRRRSGPRPVGAHAWLVPTEQARTEAQWTRQSLVHASESKHGRTAEAQTEQRKRES